MARVFSGIQPSGTMHLGNYLGAVRNWVEDQSRGQALYCVVDLHALTVEHDPATLASNTVDFVRWLLAAGLDPDQCILFVQSQVHEHAELSWLLECTASYGELRRMTQFKEKSHGQDSVRAGLLTYPALMAADILLYDTDLVPVGDDQRQHLELTRDLAQRFNARYGETFVVPQAAIPAVGARVMDLQEPTRKMSKTTSSPAGIVYFSDEPADIERKLRRAVTDTGSDVVYDPDERPGASNLVAILAAATGRSPVDVAAGYTQYGPLKTDTAAAVLDVMEPIQKRYREIAADPGLVDSVLADGAQRAHEIASVTLRSAQQAIGLLPRAR